ncbi:MAG: LysR substrate-binding domain-containing protein [Myxococcota bacterium]
MPHLNYHHLQYFWAVAKEGKLTRAAERLHVSQSALSAQIRLLEDQLGQPLFLRVGRSLQLTEAGHIALAYAEQIFATGNELVATLTEGHRADRQVLRIGAVATLSRNFQESFVRPLLERRDIDLVLQSGSLAELLTRLSSHTVDLVLSNRPVLADAQAEWRCRRIARQQVSLVGPPRGRRPAPFRFPEDLEGRYLLLPSVQSEIRTAFDLLCEQLSVRPQVLAEVDDMAMLRLLARDTDAIALLPTVVVRDELREGALQEYCPVPHLVERFYAITVRRHFQPPLLKALLSRERLAALEEQLRH